MKKYFAEMVGTFVLTFMGCGAAVSLNCGSDVASVVGTAMAFGIAVVAMAYTIGGVSGCHINPAITVGCLFAKRIGKKDAAGYILFQILGGILAGALLYGITSVTCTDFGGTTTGANSCAGAGSQLAGFIVEAVLTFIFVLVVLGTTDSKKGAGQFAGLAIGLSLILVHLVGIHYTGTSVNPARSIGPAIFEGGQALTDLWVFIVAPLVGAFFSALVWAIITECPCKNNGCSKSED